MLFSNFFKGKITLLIEESTNEQLLPSVILDSLIGNVLQEIIKPKYIIALQLIFSHPNPAENFLDVLRLFQINYYSKS